MKAGDLRHRVVAARLEETIDAAGAIKRDYVTFAQFWAKIRDLSGSSLTSAQQVNPEVRVQLTVRYRRDIEPLMRISNAYRHFYVAAVLDTDGRQEFLELLCTEKDLHAHQS